MKKQFTLGRQERIKSRKLTEELFSKGRRFNVTPLRVQYVFKKEESKVETQPLQFGVGVSTRNFKKAVDRNRIKRLLREACRLQKNPLKLILEEQKSSLAVFFIYTGRELPGFDLITEKVRLALQKLIDLTHEANT